MSGTLFPMWQIDRREYATVCNYLGLTPNDALYERLDRYLGQAPFRFARPRGFAQYLAACGKTRFRLARLDLATRLFLPAHPVRHQINAVIALHECDGRGFREMSAAPSGVSAWLVLLGRATGFALNLALTLPWIAWHAFVYGLGAPWRGGGDLQGRCVLITGVSRGLGRDLLLHCLERGAHVVGTVRTEAARGELQAMLPAGSPVTLIVADLSRPGALAESLGAAGIAPESVDTAIACAGVKHAGASALAVPALRETVQVNLFGAVELAAWLVDAVRPPSVQPPRRRSLVLVSSMGRWHGMHGSGGYNASKAALSIWGESLEMDLRRAAGGRVTVTIVEPGLFASDMTRPTAWTRWLAASRRDVASAIMAGAAAGRRVIRPPIWFAWLTWAVCLAGRPLRARLFARAKPGEE